MKNSVDDTLVKEEQLVLEINDMIEAMKIQMKEFCDENGIKPEEFENYLNNPDNFSPEEWKKLQKKKKELKDEVQRDIDNLPSPKESMRKLMELRDVADAIRI